MVSNVECAALVLFIGLYMFGLGISLMALTYEQATLDAMRAVEECEAELPRNLNCEAVITARVKDQTDE